MTDTAPLSPATAFGALGDARFVSLTTFRKSGQRVSTPVWIARDGNALVVTTPASSGKVKRLRHDVRVELQACSRGGRVHEDAPLATGKAEIVTDDERVARLTDLIRRKYGLEYHAVMGLERLTSRGPRNRVVLRITPA